MQLNKEQKEDLKALSKHRGFKILEQIVEDKRQSLYAQFESVAMWDDKVLESITCTQNYIKGMRYLLDTAKSNKEIIKAPDMS